MVDRDTVRRGYDQVAATYAAHRTENERGTEILARFLEALDDPDRILDAGCGQGTPVLARLTGAASAVGADLSREQLRLAAETVPAAHLLQSDMTALPFTDGSFDAVVAYWSLIHIPAEDHRTVIEEFARVLRPGGRVLVCEGTTEWTGANPDWLDRGVEMQWDIAGADATRAQLRDAGFEIADSWGVPETLHGDDDESEADGELPWTVFAAELNSHHQ